MNWRQITRIFIIMLILVNIFLIVFSGYTHYMSSSIGNELRENITSVLYKNGIELSDKVVPTKNVKTLNFVQSPSSERCRKLASDILGKTAEFDKNTGTYISEDGAYISFNEMTVSCSGLKFSGDAERAATKFAAEFDTKIVKHYLITRENNTYVFGQYIDGKPFYGSTLIVSIKDGTLFTEGTYIYELLVPSSEKFYTDAANVLMKLIFQLPDGGKITELKLCYVVERSMNDVQLKPAYRVMCDNGIYMYFDAKSASRIK